MDCLVTDGDQRATLAVVRALGEAGVSITVGSERPNSLAGSSRYCAKRLCYPSPCNDPDGFQASVREELQANHYRILIPMTDVTMRLASQMRSGIARETCLPVPSEEQIRRAQDKRLTLLLANKVGIACPKTFMLDESESLAEVASRVPYPVVIKPRFSWWLRDGRWVSGTVQYAHNNKQLADQYHESHLNIPAPLVQERIEGEGRGVFLLLWKGQLKAAFCHRRLREKPPWGGVSVLRESISLDQELVEKSLALLQLLDWEGPAMVEFKLDRRDGQAKLMEINGRFWGSLQLASDAGVNFPFLLYRLAKGDDVPSQFDYKVGVKSRWLLGDLDNLLIHLTHSPESNGFSIDQRSKLRATLDFMKLYEPGLHYEIFRIGDPRPGWHEWMSYIRELLRSGGPHAGGGNAR